MTGRWGGVQRVGSTRRGGGGNGYYSQAGTDAGRMEGGKCGSLGEGREAGECGGRAKVFVVSETSGRGRVTDAA